MILLRKPLLCSASTEAPRAAPTMTRPPPYEHLLKNLCPERGLAAEPDSVCGRACNEKLRRTLARFITSATLETHLFKI